MSKKTKRYKFARYEHQRKSVLSHHPNVCAGEICSLHNRTDHPMRAFPQQWNAARRMTERICPHGVGHPDPDDKWIRTGLLDGAHDCDGCCQGVVQQEMAS